MQALVFEEFGGPEVLRYRELPDPPVQAGHVTVDVKASGLNFADLYRRRGNYRALGEAPYINGYEGAGVVTGIGPDVTGFQIGDRVGFFDVARANVTKLNVPADRAIPLPGDVGLVDAASVLLQGLTAQYLCHDSAPVREGDWVLVHAAAGGVGRHLVRFCSAKGARVIAMASTEEKRRTARELGAELALGYDGDWVSEIRNSTDGGARIVFDGVGSTLKQSLAATRPLGSVVTFGMAGGTPEAIDVLDLMASSKSLVGGELWEHLATPAARKDSCHRLFTALSQGILQYPPIETFPLADGAEAHRRLEDRAFAGKIVLVHDGHA